MKKLAAVLEVLAAFLCIFFAIFIIRLTLAWAWQRNVLKYEFINSGLMYT